MNLIEQTEIEDLKKEYIYLSGLLEKHNREALYQKSQFNNSVAYGQPKQSHYSKIAMTSSRFNHSNVYRPKCYGNTLSYRKFPYDITKRSFTAKNYSHKLTPVSTLPSYNSAKQPAPWKDNKTSSSTQKLCFSSSFKTVGISNSAKVTKLNGVEGAKSNNFLQHPVTSNSSKNSYSSLEKSPSCNKSTEGTKVSYLSCSDCVIEISEYANGELRINQKKNVPSENKQNDIKDNGVSGSLLGDVNCKKSPSKTLNETMCAGNLRSGEESLVCSKPVIGLKPNSAALGLCPSAEHLGCTDKGVECDVGKMDNTLATADLTSKRECVPSPSKSIESQPLYSRNAMFSKISANTMKSAQNSASKRLVKNKYSVKKSNVVKCNSKLKYRTNREIKFHSYPAKYVYIAKLPLSSTFSKSLVTSVSKRTVLPPVKPFVAGISNPSCAKFKMHGQSHSQKSVLLRQKIPVTKSDVAISSRGQLSKKTRVLNVKNVYKVVNGSNPLGNRVFVKNSPLHKALFEKCISSPVQGYNNVSDKKWFRKVIDGSKNLVHPSPVVMPQQNVSENCSVNSVSKEMFDHLGTSCEASGYKLKNQNESKIITRHHLLSIPQKKYLIKTSATPLHKSLSDCHTPVKKAKKIRLSKTTYKVVNRHVSHVSQVVQMIKTKYRTVNKRSASNSHLKWLHEQKNTYVKRKLQRSHVCGSKGRWINHHHAAEHFRKCAISHPKTSRKLSIGRKKILKEIHGVTYRVSKTKINKSPNHKILRKNVSCNRKNSKILNVRGNKFQLSPGGKSLKRLGTLQQRNRGPLRRIKIGGSTYIQQKESRTQNLASRMLHRSIHTVRTAQAKKTMRKSNVLCMFFNRFGRCNKEGNCPYIHDPSKIAVCTRFLRGTCKTDGCPFSHEVSPGKMAICAFFLQGNCTNGDCAYRHTTIKPGTKLCKAFVKGYCSNGSQCQEAHILACPQLMCEGFCEKGSSCEWPHPPLKKGMNQTSGLSKVNNESKETNSTVDNITTDVRYFTYEPVLTATAQCVKQSDSHQDSTQIGAKVQKIRKKMKFHRQPEFIPLHVSDEEF